ncbi:response regulator [Pseudoroseicyclus sp. H15]
MKVDPIRVLMIEDNPADAELAREILLSDRLHLDLDVVSDGVSALKYLRGEDEYAGTSPPDMILLDLNVPRVNGKDILAAIKTDTALKPIPVVVLTSSSAERDIAESYALGANCYVTKPIDLVSFQKVVQTLESFWFTVVKLPPNGSERY